MKKNMTTSPQTRVEKMKIRSKSQTTRKRRILTGAGVLLIICAAYFILKDFQQKSPQTDTAAAKAAVQPKTSRMDSHPKSHAKTETSAEPSEDKTTEASTVSSSDYILPDSDKRVLSEQDIAGLSKDQLYLARNEIYARHGYIFKIRDLQNYFSSKPWYHTDPSFKGTLSQLEQKNVILLKAREDSM